MVRARFDYTGQTFGKLTAVEYLGMTDQGQQRYRFTCECGGEIETRISKVVSGEIKGCGCLVGRTIKHGHYVDDQASSEYATWQAMIQRCQNPNHHAYDGYGGRGITVCRRWLKFENFLADMGLRPKGMTLERRNNHKGYNPDNCYWATRKQQQRNLRSNRMVIYRGEKMCVAEAIERAGSVISIDRVVKRLNRGWTVDAAVELPSLGRGGKR